MCVISEWISIESCLYFYNGMLIKCTWMSKEAYCSVSELCNLIQFLLNVCKCLRAFPSLLKFCILQFFSGVFVHTCYSDIVDSNTLGVTR